LAMAQAAQQAHQEHLAAIELQRMTQQQQANEAAFNAGLDRFRNEFPMFAEDENSFRRVQEVAARLNILPGLINAHGGNIELGVRDALRMAASYDPTLEGRMIQSRLDSFAANHAALEEKKRLAASTTATFTPPVNNGQAVDLRALTASQREKMMVEELRQSLAGAVNN